MKYFLILAIASVFAVSCASTDEVVKRIDAQTWEVIQLGAKSLLDVDDITLPTMSFDSEKKTVSGSTGCNSYSGGYNLDVYGLTFDENMIMTKKACPGASTETAFMDAIQKAATFEIDGDELKIMDTAGLQILKARAAGQ